VRRRRWLPRRDRDVLLQGDVRGRVRLPLCRPEHGLPHLLGDVRADPRRAGRGPARGGPRFHFGQHELYTTGEAGEEGHHDFDFEAQKAEDPTYVLINGEKYAITPDVYGAATVGTDETVRVFYAVGGPNLTSSFHPIGSVWDEVYPQGSVESQPQVNVQTTPVIPGSAVVATLHNPVPGPIKLVDHALSRVARKGALAVVAVEGRRTPKYSTPTRSDRSGPSAQLSDLSSSPPRFTNQPPPSNPAAPAIHPNPGPAPPLGSWAPPPAAVLAPAPVSVIPPPGLVPASTFRAPICSSSTPTYPLSQGVWPLMMNRSPRRPRRAGEVELCLLLVWVCPAVEQRDVVRERVFVAPVDDVALVRDAGLDRLDRAADVDPHPDWVSLDVLLFQRDARGGHPRRRLAGLGLVSRRLVLGCGETARRDRSDRRSADLENGPSRVRGPTVVEVVARWGSDITQRSGADGESNSADGIRMVRYRTAEGVRSRVGVMK